MAEAALPARRQNVNHACPGAGFGPDAGAAEIRPDAATTMLRVAVATSTPPLSCARLTTESVGDAGPAVS
jgi:hypothetical protein